ncbi:hypothetical protein JW933_11830, partial [candidate division FCPU426 bacterium]|nr:hypothetical protein [candidate division FCPU426 bacterium]
HQTQATLRDTYWRNLLRRSQEPELAPMPAKPEFTAWLKQKGMGQSMQEYVARQKDNVNITQAQILSLAMNLLPAGLLQDLRQSLDVKSADWLNKEAGVQTLLNALEALDPGQHPYLQALQTLLQQAKKLPDLEQQVVVKGILSNVTGLRSGRKVSLAAAQPAAHIQTVRVMGLPEAETGALIALLAAMRPGLPEAEAQVLDAVIQAMQSAAGRPLDSLHAVAADRKTRQLLAGALAQLPSSTVAQAGRDFQQAVYSVAVGVQEVVLPGGAVSLPYVGEIPSEQEPAQVEQQACDGAFAEGTAARLFVKRAEKPGRFRNVLSPVLGRILKRVGMLLPDVFGLRIAFNTWLLRMNPGQVMAESLALLPAGLRQAEVVQAIQEIDMQGGDPLAVAYRQLGKQPSPFARQRLAKILLHMVRMQMEKRGQAPALAAEARDRAELTDWLALSQLLENLGCLPLAPIAKADKITGKALWAPFPAELVEKGISLPVVLFNVQGGKGALGFATQNLDRHPAISLDERVLRLFLRRGLMRFSAAA